MGGFDPFLLRGLQGLELIRELRRQVRETGGDLSRLDDLVPTGVFLQVAEASRLGDSAYDAFERRAREAPRLNEAQRRSLNEIERAWGGVQLSAQRSGESLLAAVGPNVVAALDTIIGRIDRAGLAFDRFGTLVREKYDALPGPIRGLLEGQTPGVGGLAGLNVRAQSALQGLGRGESSPTVEGLVSESSPVDVTNNFYLQGTTVGAGDIAREVELSVVQGVAGRASG